MTTQKTIQIKKNPAQITIKPAGDMMALSIAGDAAALDVSTVTSKRVIAGEAKAKTIVDTDVDLLIKEEGDEALSLALADTSVSPKNLMVGADAIGTANTLIGTHISNIDPHTQYQTETELESIVDNLITTYNNSINV